MKPENLLTLFEELAQKLDISLVQGKGNFSGGLCLLDERTYIVLNKAKPIEQRLRVLAREFGNLDLTDVYLVPVLRSYIEEVYQPLFEGEAV